MSVRERRPWVVGVISLLAITLATLGAFSIDKIKALRGVYSIAADLEDAAGLRPGNEVRVAGVKVGEVTGVDLTPSAARVEMEVGTDIDLPSETRVEVKLKTLLGQKLIDLQLPRTYVDAAAQGEDASQLTDHFLEDGDVIPLEQTSVPFEIYQAANEGTAVLEDVDKESLRQLLIVLGKTFDRSKGEMRRALVSLDRAGEVLGDQGGEISTLLKNANQVTATLAGSDQDIDEILGRSTEVLTTLADSRDTLGSLLIATDDLAADLGTLIQVARGSIQLGSRDLNSILTLAEGELDSIEALIAELPVAQEMFGRPLSFGRFNEAHVCAATSEDTCVPHGTPQNPGVPQHNVQPQRPMEGAQ